MRGAIEAFLARKEELGREATTLKSYRERLQMILGAVMERPIRAVVGRGLELYTAAQAGRAPDTHQSALVLGKMWGGWLVRQRWLKVNPFAEVEPVGRRAVGADKPRLTVDESRRLDAWCCAHPRDMGAVLTLAYLLLGPRASELVRRDVRDLDDGGRLLWIGKTKTRAGRRRLLVPPVLERLMVGLAAGRPSDAPLFSEDGRQRLDRWAARRHVDRCCAAAGVPQVAPQGLRRTQATLATEAGATGLMVAQHLGHALGEAPEVTHRSYVGRDAARDAQVKRGMRVIQGGRR